MPQYQVIKKAFFKSSTVHPGDIIVTDEKLPKPCSWAKLVKQKPSRAPKGKTEAPEAPEAPEVIESFDEVQDDGVESL